MTTTLNIQTPDGQTFTWPMMDKARAIDLSEGEPRILGADAGRATMLLSRHHGRWVFRLVDDESEAFLRGTPVRLLALPAGEALEVSSHVVSLIEEPGGGTGSRSSPSVTVNATMMTVNLGGHDPFLFAWMGGYVRIGRGSRFHFQDGCLIIPDPGISKDHCALTREDDGVRIEDLGSRNGTFINGRRLEGTRRLEPNDKITAGNATIIWAPADISPRRRPVNWTFWLNIILGIAVFTLGGWQILEAIGWL